MSLQIGGALRFRPRELHCRSVYTDRSGVNNAGSGGLTFDMRGGRQPAKPDVGRPLDGRVRARLRSAHAFRRMPTGDDAPCCWRHEDEALERTFDCTGLHAVADCELAESKHCALAFASGRARQKRRGMPCSSRRLSAVLLASRHHDAAEEPVALTADKRAAAWTSARCTCQARAGPTNTGSLTTRKSSNV